MKRRRRRQQRMLMLAGVVALLVIVLIVIISSCSKKNQTGGINAQAFSTGSELVLPLNAELNSGDYVSYGGYHFETKTKLAKMAKLITKNNENVTAANYDNAYGAAVLFTRDTGSGVESWCLYQQDPTHISNWYVFMGCHREVSMPDGILDMLLPLHLISDSYLRDNMGSRLALDTAYACGAKSAEATMQDQFKEFYANSGLYNMITLDTGFILTDKASGREVEFSFEETDESSWFTLKSTVPEEPEPSSRVQLSSTDAASEQEPVELSEADAITLSTILVNASYKTGTTASEYPYKATMNGADYMLELTWKDDTWSASVQNGDQTARLTTKQARMLFRELSDTAEQIQWILDTQTDAVHEAALLCKDAQSALFVGRGMGAAISYEGALKLKEVSYLHAEAYAAGEMKHGPIALIDPGFPVIAVATKSATYDKTVSNLMECKARGAKVIVVATEGDEEINKIADCIIRVPAVRDVFSPITASVPLQLLAREVAILRGCDVDQPRNLAKSVTVE